jgi:cation diffusion facilitator family transporter
MSVTTKEYVKEINTVSMVTLIANAVLSLAKLLAGIFASSSALISDSVHSLSDCFSTIVVIIGVHIAAKKSDKKHPYGYERMECIAALVLAAMLLATAIILGYGGVTTIISVARGGEVTKPKLLALIVAAVSVLVKGWMYFYTEGKAKKLKSTSLHGDAVHHLSDSLSSVGAIIGIVGAMCGIGVLDSIASLFIALMIVKAAWDICRSAIDQLVDEAADDETERAIADAVMTTEGVERIDVLRTRKYANKIFVDVEIAVNPDLSLLQSHKIAERVHERVEHEIGEEIKHCMVHVNPLGGEDNHESPQGEMEEN